MICFLCLFSILLPDSKAHVSLSAGSGCSHSGKEFEGQEVKGMPSHSLRSPASPSSPASLAPPLPYNPLPIADPQKSRPPTRWMDCQGPFLGSALPPR